MKTRTSESAVRSPGIAPSHHPRTATPFALRILLVALAIETAGAAVNPTIPPDVSYITGSTRKIEQLIGNTDFQTLRPTTNRTQTR